MKRLVIDHLAVVSESLAEGVRHVERALGVTLSPGGKHPTMGTHNQLLSLGEGTYLEVISIDPDAPKPPHPRWFALDEFSGEPRLTNWIARVPDLDAALAAGPAGLGQPIDLARGDLRWRMGVPGTGHLPFDEAHPALIEWQGALHPAALLPDLGFRLLRLTVSHPRAADLAEALGSADPRVRFVQAAHASLSAEIDTPFGPRLLA